MKNLLAFLAAVGLTFAAMGWYLGWYKVKTVPASAGHRSVNVDVDTVRMHDDLHKFGEESREWIEKQRKHLGQGAGDPNELGAGETQEKR
jgi:hypothetical protein